MEPAKLDTLNEHPQEEGLEVHPAITLIIARMESHPREFYKYTYNPNNPRSMQPNTAAFITAVNQTMEHTKSLWNRKEKRLYNLALRKVRLEEAHERLMATLLQAK